ncbi:MAG: type II toxin-antitoxin system PemK/MazF family toxin [Acidimicrobiales bacterium]
MVVRGETWWADFGEPLGSEPGFRRPAVVISSERFKRSASTREAPVGPPRRR